MKKKINLLKLSKNQLNEVKAGAAMKFCVCGCYEKCDVGVNEAGDGQSNLYFDIEYQPLPCIDYCDRCPYNLDNMF